jgi:hypothetical protein
MAVDKELLFKGSLPEADVEIPGKGITVRVRALTRHEAMSIQQVKDGPGRVEAIERKMLALALVDPEMTEAEVGRWQQASVAGEMEPVGLKVNELSGMTEGAAKAAYKEFESDADGEFRLPPG